MKYIILILIILLTGCNKTPISTLETPNPNVKVDILTTVDGCTIYRFRDGGNDNYFVKCTSGSTQAIYTVPCGKSCTEQVAITTVNQ